MQEKRVRGQKLVLCCTKRKGCPEISEEKDGFIMFDEDEPRTGMVQFDREQAALLVKFLQDRLSR